MTSTAKLRPLTGRIGPGSERRAAGPLRPCGPRLRYPVFAAPVAAGLQKADRCPCSASAVSAAGSASAAQSRTRGRLPSQALRASSPPGRASVRPWTETNFVVRQTKTASSVVTIQQKEPFLCPLSLAPLDSSPARVGAKTKPLGYCLPRVRDCAAEAHPADETAEAEQGQRSAFCEGVATPEAKAGHRNCRRRRRRGPELRGEP